MGRCSHCRGDGHLVDSCTRPSPDFRERPANSPVCLCCMELGHFARHCPGRIFCSHCHLYGHRADYCVPSDLKLCRVFWVPKEADRAASTRMKQIWVPKSKQSALFVIDDSPPEVSPTKQSITPAPCSSPPLVEDAAERLLNGIEGGQSQFIRGGDPTLQIVLTADSVTRRSEVTAMVNQAQGSVSVLAASEFFSLTADDFALFWKFMIEKLYCKQLCILDGLTVDQNSLDMPSVQNIWHQMALVFFNQFLFLCLHSVALMDVAEIIARKAVMEASCFTAHRGEFVVDEFGTCSLHLEMAPTSSFNTASESDGPLSSSESFLSAPSLTDAHGNTASSATYEAQASNQVSRPRKRDKKIVESAERRITRQNNRGFKHQSIPNTPRRATAPKAKKPEVLRLEEMRRMGIERCSIAPDELTDDKLLQARLD